MYISMFIIVFTLVLPTSPGAFSTNYLFDHIYSCERGAYPLPPPYNFCLLNYMHKNRSRLQNYDPFKMIIFKAKLI